VLDIYGALIRDQNSDFLTLAEIALARFRSVLEAHRNFADWGFCWAGIMVEEQNLPAGKAWKVCDRSSPAIQPESVC